MSEEVLIEIKGTVEHIVYQNQNNGYTVLEMNNGEELITAVGIMPYVSAGEELTIYGTWTSHPSFGEQFKVKTFEKLQPHTSEAILTYLSSGGVKGIGLSTARKLVEMFGENTLYIMENEPERMSEIKGITKSKAVQISENMKNDTSIRDIMAYLSQYGLTPQESVSAYQQYGTNIKDIISSNPYMLCSEPVSISFSRADQIAVSFDMVNDDICRIEAGIIFVLKHNLLNGHSCLPKDKLIKVSAQMLGVNLESTEDAMTRLLEQKTLIPCNMKEREFCFLPEYYSAELNSANRLQMMLQYPSAPINNIDDSISRLEKETGKIYAEEQRQAIVAAASNGFLILTGGPGTGKTTTLLGIITILKKHGEKVLLAAPTGRAAKRMSQMTGEEAKTIHRLLKVEWDENEHQSFAKNEKNLLECDALIIDELSMVDSLLFNALLLALPMGCRLILVGDSNQLPSVSAGNVLGDLISSKKFPVIELKHIFRQSMESLIITNAHSILSGNMPVLTDHSRDFFFLPCSENEMILNTILDLVKTRLPKTYNLSTLDDLQVISVGRKGALGTIELNKQLQNILNPENHNKHEIKIDGRLFREGDKIMQIKNDYQLSWQSEDGTQGEGIFNGDIGRILKIDKRNSVLKAQFDDKIIEYEFGMTRELDLAYAMTVHKSQGSEFYAVVMPVYSAAPQLLYRNLLYTAITRAKHIIVLVGSSSIIKKMIDNDKKTKRFSGLKYFLTDEVIYEA